jgi:L-amino acid N-acyltransferase YncA
MSHTLHFRLAEPADAAFLAEVYNSTMPGGRVTAETEPVTVESRIPWLAEHDPKKRPCWILEVDGQAAGTVYFTDFKPRAAYSITAEISIYLQPSFQKKGLGTKMLTYAMAQAPFLGIETVVGLIYDINEVSLRLFEQAGFERWGYLPRATRHAEGERGLVLVAKRTAS